MLILIALGGALAFLLLYWFSHRNRDAGEAIAHLCLLVASPCNAVHDDLMAVFAYVRDHLPRPKKVKQEELEEEKEENKEKVDTLHRKAYDVICDMVTAFVGSIIIAADAYMAYVFNSSLFNTHEVSLSGGMFEWAASLLWIATPAMYGIVALEAAGIVKSSGLFPHLGKGARWLVGLISFVLMCLSIFLVMYAYSFRGVKIFDPTNTYQIAQMGESTLALLGLLVGAASIFSLVALQNALSTLVTILLFALLVFCFVAAKLLHLLAIVLDRIAISCTDGRICVFEKKEAPAQVTVTPVQEPLSIPAAADHHENGKTEQVESANTNLPAQEKTIQQDDAIPENNNAFSWFPVVAEPLTSEQSNGHTEPLDESKKKELV